MKDAQMQHTVAPVSRLIMLVATISLGGCISNYSLSPVLPGEAAQVLRKGDTVTITRKDDSVVHLKIREIDVYEIYGSDQTSMFGRVKKTIPLDDVASISLSRTEKGFNTEETIEAWSYLLILWPFFVF